MKSSKEKKPMGWPEAIFRSIETLSVTAAIIGIAFAMVQCVRAL